MASSRQVSQPPSDVQPLMQLSLLLLLWTVLLLLMSLLRVLRLLTIQSPHLLLPLLLCPVPLLLLHSAWPQQTLLTAPPHAQARPWGSSSMVSPG